MEEPRLFENPYDKFGELTTVQQLVLEQLRLNKTNMCVESHPGTGKTIAGLFFIYYFNTPALVLSTKCQVNDQWEEVAKELLFTEKTTNNCIRLGDKDTRPLDNSMLQRYHLIICTPQKLINAIRRKDVDLSKIKTAVYDEAHHLLTSNKSQLFRLFQNQLFLSATFPQQFESTKVKILTKYSMQLIRPPRRDKLIDEVPVSYVETLSAINQITSGNTSVKDYFLNTLFNSALTRIFKTPARVLITTRLIKAWVLKFRDILSILIGNKTGNNIKDHLKCCLLRSANTFSYFVDLSKVDIRALQAYIDEAFIAYRSDDVLLVKIRHARERIKRNLATITDNDPKASAAVENLLRGNYSTIEFEKIFRECGYTLTYEARKFINDYIQLYEAEEKDTVAIDGILTEMAKRFPTIERTKDTMKIIKASNLFISTNQRIQEGFNCEEITLGYFRDFTYSYTARAQILGRIRRKQSNPDSKFIHNFPRFAYCVVNQPLRMVMDNKVFYNVQYRMLGSIQDQYYNADPNTVDKYLGNLSLYRQVYYSNFNYEHERKMLVENNYRKMNDLHGESTYAYVREQPVPDTSTYYKVAIDRMISAIVVYITTYLNEKSKESLTGGSDKSSSSTPTAHSVSS